MSFPEPPGAAVGRFFRARRTSLQKVSREISMPSSESRCQTSLSLFPERSARSMSGKRQFSKAVKVVGGSSDSFSNVRR